MKGNARQSFDVRDSSRLLDGASARHRSSPSMVRRSYTTASLPSFVKSPPPRITSGTTTSDNPRQACAQTILPQGRWGRRNSDLHPASHADMASAALRFGNQIPASDGGVRPIKARSAEYAMSSYVPAAAAAAAEKCFFKVDNCTGANGGFNSTTINAPLVLPPPSWTVAASVSTIEALSAVAQFFLLLCMLFAVALLVSLVVRNRL